MSKKSTIGLGLLAGAGVMLAARRAANAPPDLAVAERAREAQYSGPWRHGFADVNDVRLHYAELGSGPLVILLHGFPECWYEWHYVLPRLAQHYHVVAPDMRGYNLSSKPEGVAEYDLQTLSGDVAALITFFGEERAHVVGHDWGGVVAWHFGAARGDRLNKLAIINAPHPAAYRRELLHSDQVLRSYYVFLFQVPILAEAVSRATIRTALTSSAAVPGAFSEESLDVYQNNISQPGAATAMLNYYRSLVRNTPLLLHEADAKITNPTMLLWGMKDFALVPSLADNLDEWVSGIRVERQPESGHWVPEEKPGWVADKLLDFFGT